MVRRQYLRLPVRLIAVLIGALSLAATTFEARAAEPIKIGFGMALTGGIAANGRAALLAMQIWAEDVNAKGGILGRPVKLIYYDDQSNPSTVPGLYTKLLDVDKVDFAVSGYATNMIAPAMPVMIQRNKLFLGLFGLAVNSEFHYPKYFSILPAGPDPKIASAQGFFEVAMAQNPKPQTIAIVGADTEFSRNATDGAQSLAKANKVKVVYDRRYPPTTTDYTPIVRAIQATRPDMVFVASYPPDSVGMIHAANEVGLDVKLFGGNMVGLQSTSIKQQLGPLMNGIVNYDFYIPAPKMKFPGIDDFFKKYQARASSEGVDPLGWYLPPFAYADLQTLAQAIEGTKSLDDEKLAAYLRTHTMKTIVGDFTFGKDGEWSKSRELTVQFQHIKSNDLSQFRDASTEVILAPDEYKSGDIIYPYKAAKQ